MRRPDTWTPKSLDRSCTGGWIPAQQDLIRLLSAQDWELDRTSLPPLTSFLGKMIRQKKPHLAQMMIEDEASNRGWEADIIKAALTGFLAKGPRAADTKVSPGGLTVFMFAPYGYNQRSTMKDRAASIREAFGDDSLSEDAVQAAAKVKYDAWLRTCSAWILSVSFAPALRQSPNRACLL